MTELTRTNDPVRLCWLLAVLDEAGIPAIVFDTHTSIVEGSIGAIPRRVMIDDADAFRARLALRAAEETIS
jgi:Putative prokaryotic signal transducing protein